MHTQPPFTAGQHSKATI